MFTLISGIVLFVICMLVKNNDKDHYDRKIDRFVTFCQLFSVILFGDLLEFIFRLSTDPSMNSFIENFRP